MLSAVRGGAPTTLPAGVSGSPARGILKLGREPLGVFFPVSLFVLFHCQRQAIDQTGVIAAACLDPLLSKPSQFAEICTEFLSPVLKMTSVLRVPLLLWAPAAWGSTLGLLGLCEKRSEQPRPSLFKSVSVRAAETALCVCVKRARAARHPVKNLPVCPQPFPGGL